MSDTWAGSIIVANVMMKSAFLKRKSKRANPYATIVLVTTVPRVARIAISMVLRYHSAKGNAVNASTKLYGRGWTGMRTGGKAYISSGNFSALKTAQQSGKMKITASTVVSEYRTARRTG